MPAHFFRALLAAILTIVLLSPIVGLPLAREGVKTVLQSRWLPVLWGALAVFIVQLAHPLIARLFSSMHLPREFNIDSQRYQPWLWAGLIMLAVIWPFWTGRAAVDIASLALIYIMLGLGLNIVVGFAGLLDLGFVGFYAIGAYTYALLFQWADWSFWQALPLAGAIAALFGFLLGFPVLRLRGDYLAIVTLGFGEIIRLLLTNLVDITGGPDGIASIPKPTLFGLEMTRRASTQEAVTFHDFFNIDFNAGHMVIFFYLLALTLALITLWVSNRLVRMPIGRAWEALREDEIACRSLGLNPTHIKLSAFTLGAMFAGFGGALFAARQGLVNPESFTFIESALILAVVVLGGMGSQLGVILAAIVLTALPEIAREFAEYRMLAFGFFMVLMMVWRPQGLLPMKRIHLKIRT